MLRKLGYLWKGAHRRLGQRRAFAGTRDISVLWYDAALRFFPRFPLPGRGRLVSVRMAALRAPLRVRLGTSDGYVLEEIFVREIYRDVTDGKLGPIKLVIDLGSNVGLSLRLWSERFADATLVGVEPSSANLEACRANLAIAGITAQLHRAAISNVEGKVFLDTGDVDCAFRTSAEGGGRGEWVQAITMDLLLAPFAPTQEIDLLKCDVEGAEELLFKDCAGWIGRVRNLLVETHPPYSAERLFSDLRANGYEFRVVMHQPGEHALLFLQRAT